MSPDPSLAALTTEQPNPASQHLDTLSSHEVVRLMHAEDRRMLDAVERVLPLIGVAIDAIAERLRQGGHLIYIGAGTSGRLGVLDASECPPTFSTPSDLIRGIIAGGSRALQYSVEGAEDAPDLGARDVRQAALQGDAVAGLSASGRTPYVIGALQAARELGALTIGVACVEQPVVAAVCDLVIAPVVGPEVVTGSTRLKAGTAQKLVLNMLSTGVMVRLGKVYGNLMVDVSPTNAKLRDRATRIVQQATGVTASVAQAALAASDWEPKTAMVSINRGVGPAEARALLAAAHGHVRAVLG